MEEKKETKVVKSYSLPPSQVAWLRQQALNESTAEQTVSASAVLERIVSEAMAKAEKDAETSSPTPQKKRSALTLESVAA